MANNKWACILAALLPAAVSASTTTFAADACSSAICVGTECYAYLSEPRSFSQAINDCAQLSGSLLDLGLISASDEIASLLLDLVPASATYSASAWVSGTRLCSSYGFFTLESSSKDCTSLLPAVCSLPVYTCHAERSERGLDPSATESDDDYSSLISSTDTDVFPDPSPEPSVSASVSASFSPSSSPSSSQSPVQSPSTCISSPLQACSASNLCGANAACISAPFGLTLCSCPAGYKPVSGGFRFSDAQWGSAGQSYRVFVQNGVECSQTCDSADPNNLCSEVAIYEPEACATVTPSASVSASPSPTPQISVSPSVSPSACPKVSLESCNASTTCGSNAACVTSPLGGSLCSCTAGFKPALGGFRFSDAQWGGAGQSYRVFVGLGQSCSVTCDSSLCPEVSLYDDTTSCGATPTTTASASASPSASVSSGFTPSASPSIGSTPSATPSVGASPSAAPCVDRCVGQRCFESLTGSYTEPQARAACAAAGGSLLNVNGSTEFLFVNDLLRSYQFWTDGYNGDSYGDACMLFTRTSARVGSQTLPGAMTVADCNEKYSALCSFEAAKYECLPLPSWSPTPLVVFKGFSPKLAPAVEPSLGVKEVVITIFGSGLDGSALQIDGLGSFYARTVTSNSATFVITGTPTFPEGATTVELTATFVGPSSLKRRDEESRTFTIKWLKTSSYVVSGLSPASITVDAGEVAEISLEGSFLTDNATVPLCAFTFPNGTIVSTSSSWANDEKSQITCFTPVFSENSTIQVNVMYAPASDPFSVTPTTGALFPNASSLLVVVNEVPVGGGNTDVPSSVNTGLAVGLSVGGIAAVAVFAVGGVYAARYSATKKSESNAQDARLRSLMTTGPVQIPHENVVRTPERLPEYVDPPSYEDHVKAYAENPRVVIDV